MLGSFYSVYKNDIFSKFEMIAIFVWKKCIAKRKFLVRKNVLQNELAKWACKMGRETTFRYIYFIIWYIKCDEQYFIKIYVVYLVQWPYFSDNVNSKQNIGWNLLIIWLCIAGELLYWVERVMKDRKWWTGEEKREQEIKSF